MLFFKSVECLHFVMFLHAKFREVFGAGLESALTLQWTGGSAATSYFHITQVCVHLKYQS